MSSPLLTLKKKPYNRLPGFIAGHGPVRKADEGRMTKSRALGLDERLRRNSAKIRDAEQALADAGPDTCSVCGSAWPCSAQSARSCCIADADRLDARAVLFTVT
jgi:hypothetical protein